MVAGGLVGRCKGVLCVCCCDGGAVHRNPMGVCVCFWPPVTDGVL